MSALRIARFVLLFGVAFYAVVLTGTLVGFVEPGLSVILSLLAIVVMAIGAAASLSVQIFNYRARKP